MENFGFFFISFGLGFLFGVLGKLLFDISVDDRVKAELRKRGIEE
jgi:hypothetical protein